MSAHPVVGNTGTGATPKPERVGVIFVHGIGEQKRYEFLEDEARQLICEIRKIAPPAATQKWMSVELRDGRDVAYASTQNTWQTDNNHAPVRAVVRSQRTQGAGHDEMHLFLHEVWWADVNEPYDLGKQIRFWGWALSIWAQAGKRGSARPGYNREMQPAPALGGFAEFWMRLRLFFVSYIFCVGGASVGALVFLAKRVLDLAPFDVVSVFINYLSCIKLYSQQHRTGGGFLDALGEPPRVSVRRRMIRTLADVALAEYDRWYVVAHSQGTVIAFNGLSESGHAWLNYLDQPRLRALIGKGFAGTARAPGEYGTTAGMEPARPLWLEPNQIAFRERIFKNMRGFVTYGSPINKFRAIWPARVPNNKFPAFRDDCWWLNVYDKIDPVSGVLKDVHLNAIRAGTLANTPLSSPGILDHSIEPDNIGYRSSNLLFYAHIAYLDLPAGADAPCFTQTLARIIVDPAPVAGAGLPNAWLPPHYRPDDGTDRARSFYAWLQWLVLFTVVCLLAGVVARSLWNFISPLLWNFISSP
jgi:hypothetical protein